MSKGRGTVVIHFDDGRTNEFQGMVNVSRITTESDVDYADGSRRSFPVKYSSIVVVEKDIPYEVVEGITHEQRD